uniref:F-actin monooxygenase n=1 Tax=Oryzias sinensis TaxID=183150 RepID=A0A8C8DPQ3_9TELE
MGKPEEENVARLFENFIQASTCKGALQAFNVLCRRLDLDPADHDTFYSSLKAKVSCWKANALWSKLDKRMSHKEYKKGQACVNTKCLIIGGGPCGLRTAIEFALMGAKVVVLEKRDSFSRNNVLHLWPFTIHDLRGLGAKKFYGKFCAGAIDHISIQQLQLILLKVALIVAVEFHINVEFVKLLEPPEDQTNEGVGWRAAIRPADHPVANFDFDVVVGADGRKNSLDGFKRKVLRGKLAIAITANFVNSNTTAEARVEEISGVAFIFNQKFFLDLKAKKGVDLENIVYYKDNTHYFVMTAKKQSLLEKGVLINDYVETEMLLSSQNVNQEALLSYATEAANFGTHYQLPTLKFAENHCGQPDVAMFDFTNMYASENAALIRERHGHQLLVALVGDSLLEPFWPMGTGCARGFLSGFDTAWMVRSWAEGRSVLEVLAERESIYRLLPQTTPENIAKNFDLYTIDPSSRYTNLNSTCVRPNQVHHLYITGELNHCSLERTILVSCFHFLFTDCEIRPSRLLTWCKKQTEGYRNVSIKDLTSSWKSGIALCALIHRFKPQLIDFDSLNEEDHRANLQLALDISEQEFGIQPFTSVKEQSTNEELDKSRVIAFLSKFYELFRGSPLPASGNGCVTNLSYDTYVQDKQNSKDNKVGTLSTQLLAKFEINSSSSVPKTQGTSVRRAFSQSSEKCHSCKKRVYMIERVRAEGLCFHRECFRCSICSRVLYFPEKLYCRPHFDQQNNGTHLKRSFTSPSNQFGVEERNRAAEEDSACGSTVELQSRPAAGTCSLFTRKQLSWPLSVTRAVCKAPSYLSCCVRSAAQAVAGHLRDNAHDYTVLFELLSMSLPLLFVLQEVLLQMHTEAVTDGPSILQPALFWLQERIGLN